MATTQDSETGLFVTELTVTGTVTAEYASPTTQNTPITLYRAKSTGEYVTISLSSRAEDALLAILLGRKGITPPPAAQVFQ